MKKKVGTAVWFLGLLFCTWWAYLYQTDPGQYAIKTNPGAYTLALTLLICTWLFCLFAILASISKRLLAKNQDPLSRQRRLEEEYETTLFILQLMDEGIRINRIQEQRLADFLAQQKRKTG